MTDELREELEGLAEAWEDDAAACRQTDGPSGRSAAEVYDECAGEIRALLARQAKPISPRHAR